MDCHFLLPGIFLTQESNSGLPHCRQTLYRLSHQGSNVGDPGSILVSGRSDGEGNGNHSNILDWRTQRTENPGRLQSMRLQTARYDLLTKPPPNSSLVLTMTVQRTKSSKPFDLNMESKTFLRTFSRKTASPGARDSGRRRVNHLALFCYDFTVFTTQMDSKEVCRL